ncbi:MAG: zinc-ribbon domain-containing protein [Eubacteriaceae bacterium]|nr:zinc-ribbon domain-containing protein [Eubacteriaceae bacterium]
MKKCGNCGKELSDDAKFCIYCGAVQNEDIAEGLQDTAEDVRDYGLETADHVAESTMIGEQAGPAGAEAGEPAGFSAEGGEGEEAPQTWGEVGFEGAPADTAAAEPAQGEGRPGQAGTGYQSPSNAGNTYGAYTGYTPDYVQPAKKKGKAGTVVVLLLLVAALIGGAVFGYPYLKKELAYRKGVSAFTSGDYDQAFGLLAPLSDEDYKDSDSYVNFINGENAMRNGYYMEAYGCFTDAPAVEGASERAEACLKAQYDLAMEKLSAGSYDAAVELASPLKDLDYADSYKISKYAEARSFMDKGLYYSAHEIFEDIAGFMDASEMIDKCVQPNPSNGTVYRNPAYSSKSVSLTIAVKGGTQNYYIKMYNEKGDLVATAFIAADKSGTVKVPAGTYTIKEAAGTKWYGTEEMFGDDGSYMLLDISGATSFKLTAGSWKLTIGVSSGGNVGSKNVGREGF